MSDPLRVLVVEDQRAHAQVLSELLKRSGYEVETAFSFDEGKRLLSERPYDVLITDLDLAGHRGTDFLDLAKSTSEPPEVMLISGVGNIEDAVESMQLGAVHYFSKPLEVDEIRDVMAKAEARIRARKSALVTDLEPYQPRGFEGLLGTSPAMQRVYETIRRVAPTSATVLIQGENGTGKELVARAIHSLSPRRSAPFVALNCASLSEGILESELFGHEKGSFTGAAKTREGMIEHANRGTLFLDEVGDMPLSIQVKLLRVIQEREIVRVGTNRTIKVDIRLIAATNKDLKKEIQAGTFREDLYWRLKVVSIDMPPLRDRREDVPALVEAFLKESGEKHHRRVRAIDPVAVDLLTAYAWPGNVRELQGTIENMVVLSDGAVLGLADVPADIRREERSPSKALVSLNDIGSWTLDRLEREMIRLQLEKHEGNRAKAAKALGISERTLYRKLKELGL